jgi:hypothetical protein
MAGLTRSSLHAHSFSGVPQANIQRSKFDRSHGYKTTFDAGWLIPVLVDEVLPGDTFNVRMNAFCRLATPIHPIMDNIYLESFFFFVPNRLVWSNFNKFMGEQEDPGDSIDYTIPTQTYTNIVEGSLQDYMGLPIGSSVNMEVNELPFRAYHLIYNEWFRDENLIDSVPFSKADSGGLSYGLKKRGKRHDYFTSCLPWPQKGTALELPVDASTIEVDYDNNTPTTTSMLIRNTSGTLMSATRSIQHDSSGVLENSDGTDIHLDPNGHLSVTIPSSIGGTINELRQAFQIQKLLERDARGGTRYTEIIQSHFGVTSADQRLQRPEYLGGGRGYVNINPVAQTSETNTTAQGNLSAFGTASLQGHGFSKSFTEHGYIIGLVNARADLTYQNGVDKLWTRSTRYDFYWPALAHIGEQAVLNKEIYYQNTSADDDVFGYQERYAEYRYKKSVITGAFASNAATSLDSWHLSIDYDALPTLNETFISEVPPIDRVIAVPSEPHFLFDSYFKMICARPMPVRSVPGLVDHF